MTIFTIGVDYYRTPIIGQSEYGGVRMKIIKVIVFSLIGLTTFLGISLVNTTSEITTFEPGTKHIIFDMNGVLVKTKEQSGIKQLFAALLKDKYKKKLYAFLDSLEPRCANEACACDGDGLKLPQIMCNWLKGTQSSAEILAKVDAAAHTTDSMIISIAHRIFEPEQFIETQKWVPESLKLVQELKEQGHKVYILSNWDTESFALMKEKYAQNFALFDGIVISGEVGLIKPHTSIYESTLSKYQIHPSNVCFIDDQSVNIQAAQLTGIHGIECPQNSKFLTTNPDIKTVKNKIYQWLEFKSASA